MVATGYITVLLTVYLYVLQGEPGEPGRSGQKVTTRASLTDTRQLALAMKTGRWCTFNPTDHYTQNNIQRLLTLSVVSASCLAAQDEICWTELNLSVYSVTGMLGQNLTLKHKLQHGAYTPLTLTLAHSLFWGQCRISRWHAGNTKSASFFSLQHVFVQCPNVQQAVPYLCFASVQQC